MAAASKEKQAICTHCGAVLQAGAACGSCLRAAGDDAERARRYESLPPRVPTGGIIMPQ